MTKRGTAMQAAREITAENAKPREVAGLDADGWPMPKKNARRDNGPNAFAAAVDFMRQDGLWELATQRDATTAMQEFLSKRYGRWVARRRDMSRFGGWDPALAWTDLTRDLQRGVEATGKWRFCAERDLFVPVATV